ncbi:unnamed protein product [Rotaria sp. Silwood1]|nr:unnamed protein product [Rotaria sp. Silwood1]CAF1124399.1 unnamed protein product [Rotaria sp. Silwood1]CAF1306292.1 unnamed protein product [Rotaria sp. Silwood1]CAF3438129.1 unnamed protein product [Rotaria sp. Silwood1]CAF3460077.1 unnamed protein product [Rotaria sp. Silwood1]
MEDLDDEQRALIPHSLRELSLHCIYKGLELGPTVTIATVLPYQLYKSRKNLSFTSILSRVGTASIYGAIVGVVFSLGLMHAKLYNEKYNQYKIWDRAYRLRYSQSQKRVDKYAFTFSIAGGLSGLIIGLPSKFSPLSATKGALMAIPFGVLAHVITSSVQDQSNKNQKN